MTTSKADMYFTKEIFTHILGYCDDRIERERNYNYNILIGEYSYRFDDNHIPPFTLLGYIGFRPAKLNIIDKDYSEYWEEWLDYSDSDYSDSD